MEVRPRESASALDVGANTWRALPAAQRAARIRVLQATAGAEFRVTERAPGVLVADHATAGLRASFERGRVSVLPTSEDAGDSEAFELAASSWGCAGAMQPLAAELPSSPNEQPAEVHYEHASFDEWYANGPAGLEQGFTIRDLPECAKHGAKLQIRLHFSDQDAALANVTADGGEALLTTPGHHALHYSDAFAQDATGKDHTVRIIGGDALALEVDVSGATLPLLVDPLVWLERQVVVTADGAPGDGVGRSVAIFGDAALVGAPGDDDKGADSGSAYLYKRVPATTAGLPAYWGSPQKLVAADGAAGDAFGSAVALSAGIALVGAPADDDQGTNSGAVYVFALNGSTWAQQQKLVPSDMQSNDQFGSALLISETTAVIGAPFQSAASSAEVGAAYAFDQVGSSWVQQRKFVVPTAETIPNLHFGAAVAMFSDTLAIGRDSLSAGGVNWFTRGGSTWSSTSTEVLSTLPHFGSALAMTATATFIGAYGDTTKGVDAGSVSITSTAAPHASLTTLTASDGVANARFGTALSAEGSTLVVGAPGAFVHCAFPSCANPGAVYAFSFNGTAWLQQQMLVPPSAASADSFGISVSFAGRTALIGAPLHTVTAGKTGALWSYEVGLSNGSVCTQNGDCATSFCVEGVCCDGLCANGCNSCLAALKVANQLDSKTGTCGRIKVNTDPKNACTSDGTFCGPKDTCNGQGGCDAVKSGTPCGAGAPFCASPTTLAAQSACTNYTCGPYAQDCDPGYLCKAGACKTSCASNDDCNADKGFSCVAGACVLQPGSTCLTDNECSTGTCGFGVCCVSLPIYGCSTPPGALCDTNDECFTHHCVDGVCCDTACDGACQACGLPGSTGTCSPTTNDPQDPPGLCAPISGGNGGEAGEAGAPQGGNDPVTTAGSGGIVQAGGGGAAAQAGSASTQGGQTSSQGGASTQAGSGGTGGSMANAGEAAAADFGGEAGATGHGADIDQRATACGCRAAGGRGAGSSALSLLGLVALGVVRRRRKSRY